MEFGLFLPRAFVIVVVTHPMMPVTQTLASDSLVSIMLTAEPHTFVGFDLDAIT